MSNSEINGLYVLKFLSGNTQPMPCGISLPNKLWWMFVPGEIISVKWPVGQVMLHEDPGGKGGVFVESSDPNEHYRPWLEQNVGKQGWDWQWGMSNNDATENRLTIKIRRKFAERATIAALRWS